MSSRLFQGGRSVQVLAALVSWTASPTVALLVPALASAAGLLPGPPALGVVAKGSLALGSADSSSVFVIRAGPTGQKQHIRINGEPKSGTTWLEMVVRETLAVLCNLGHNCSYSQKGREALIRVKSGDRQVSVHRKHDIPGVADKAALDFTPPPELTDEELSLKAAEELAQEAGVRWLVIFRDPRDVTMSACYHQFWNCPHKEAYFKSNFPSVVKWTDLRHRFFQEVVRQDSSRALILFYEDLKADLSKQVSRLSGFLLGQEQAGTAETTEVVKRTSFIAMKAAGLAVPQGGAQTGKVRKGEVCGYRSDISPEAAVRAADILHKILSNSSLRYRWEC